MREKLTSEAFSNRLEFIIAILLGITAVLTAYASWQSSLYDGNQASSYTKGNAAIADANSMYNEADQLLAEDMETWNTISELRIDIAFAEEKGNTEDAERYNWKLDQIVADNVSDELLAAIEWADAQEEYASPFEKEGFVDSYFEDYSAKYAEGEALLAEGEHNNYLGDILGLVTVIYSVVLFLLGIVSTFKNTKTKLVITGASVIALIGAMCAMLSVPFVKLG